MGEPYEVDVTGHRVETTRADGLIDRVPAGEPYEVDVADDREDEGVEPINPIERTMDESPHTRGERVYRGRRHRGSARDQRSDRGQADRVGER